MNKCGFFKTVLSICAGPGIFSQLIKNSIYRTLGHFFLLALLCSSTVVFLRFFLLRERVEKCCRILEKKFGGAEFRKEGLFPLKGYETAGAIQIDSIRIFNITNLRINYFPDKEAAAGFDFAGGIADQGVFWMPNAVIGWTKVDNNNYFVYPLIFPILRFPVPEKISGLPIGGILAYAEKNSFSPDLFLKQPPLIFGKIRNPVLFVILCLLFINILFTILFFIPVFALFFTVVFLFTGRDVPSYISFSKLFNVAIYAGFPGMIIATLSFALELPFFDFQTVCLISSLVYLIIVLNSLQKLLGQNKDREEEFI